MGAKRSTRWKPPVPIEVRPLGRLAADPEPSGAAVTLRLRVTYGIESDEHTVLAVGSGAKVARSLCAGTLVYVVGHRADEDAEHEIHAPHADSGGRMTFVPPSGAWAVHPRR